jgi:hemerythrin superfamily protein
VALSLGKGLFMTNRAIHVARVDTGLNALDVLKADHASIRKLFTQYNKAKKGGNDSAMQQTVAAICKALTIHAIVEEEIFYRALRDSADADDQLDEAFVEHSHVKELVAQLEDSGLGSDLFEARVKVLSEYADHHFKEEEGAMFAKARKSSCDLFALGRRLIARMEDLGADAVPHSVIPVNGVSHTSQREARN